MASRKFPPPVLGKKKKKKEVTRIGYNCLLLEKSNCFARVLYCLDLQVRIVIRKK